MPVVEQRLRLLSLQVFYAVAGLERRESISAHRLLSALLLTLCVAQLARVKSCAPPRAWRLHFCGTPRRGSVREFLSAPSILVWAPSRTWARGYIFCRTRRGSFDQVSTSLSCASLSPVLSSGCLRLCKPLLHILLISCSSFPTSQQPGDTQPRAV